MRFPAVRRLGPGDSSIRIGEPSGRRARAPRAWIALSLLLLLPMDVEAEPAATATGAAATPTEAGGPAAAVQWARALLVSGREKDAIPVLKEAIERHHGAEELRWLLARAYLEDGNDFWALRTLAALSELAPDDCEPQLWTAWILTNQGVLDEAREMLAAASCPTGSSAETRRALLLSTVEQHAGQPETATQHLASARRAERIYDEDLVIMERLNSALDPGYLPLVAGKLELNVGGTSNARAGSLVDENALGGDAASPAGQMNLWLRLVAPTGGWLRPTAEFDARSQGYAAEAERELSYLSGGIRPGVLIGGGASSALLAYRFDTLLLAGGDRYGDGPRWFYDAHRAELEANLQSNLSLFGGVGRRLFRQTGRSRTEADGGLGGSVRPLRQLRILGALTGRWHRAENEAYDQWGGSALASAELRLPKQWALRAGVLVGLDWYPRSAGYFDATASDTRRRDVLLKLSASAFSPTVEGVKVGATYEYAERFSTTDPYGYRDHRLLAKIAWSFAGDPWAPSAVSPEGHVPLDHGLSSSGFDERLQDLLRQNEAAQRSSSCVD